MFFDLSRALLAALVVAVAPGWFWARLLLASSVVLYHQVASLYLAVLLAIVGAYFVLPLL